MRNITLWAILAVVLFGGCRTFQPVEVGRPSDLKVASLSGSKVNLEISLPIKNPNIWSITVTRIQAEAYINETRAGKITSNDKIKLTAGSDEEHQLKLGMDFSDLIDSNLSIMEIMRQGSVDLSIDGTLTTRSFLYKKEVPFSQKKRLRLSR